MISSNECAAQQAIPEPGRLWIGLDVGGTKIEGVAVDDAGVVRGRVLVPTDATTADHSVGSIIRSLEDLLSEVNLDPASCNRAVAAIGLGIPGKVEDGSVSLAVNLNLESYPLADVLTRRFGVPVYLENDVRAAALGAYAWLLERLPLKSMVYLCLGTGISAGVILNGQLHRGVNGMAGEVGHAIIDPGGARCKCGSVGCFETVAAGPAIARQGQEAVRAARERGEATLLSDYDPLTAEQVFSAARQGDRAARDVVARVGRTVSQVVYNLIMHYDVEIVALGGGVSHAGEVFFAPVREELARLAGESPLAREMLGGGEARKVILLPREADPAWRGMVLLAKMMARI